MKTIQEIISQKPIFLHNWNNQEEVLNDFAGDRWEDNSDKTCPENTSNIKILFASYGTDNYCGEAWVLFEQDGKLYEVNGSHCSCYGLEGQWEPERVVLEELQQRYSAGSFGTDDYSDNVFRDDIKEFLGLE